MLSGVSSHCNGVKIIHFPTKLVALVSNIHMLCQTQTLFPAFTAQGTIIEIHQKKGGIFGNHNSLDFGWRRHFQDTKCRCI